MKSVTQKIFDEIGVEEYNLMIQHTPDIPKEIKKEIKKIVRELAKWLMQN